MISAVILLYISFDAIIGNTGIILLDIDHAHQSIVLDIKSSITYFPLFDLLYPISNLS